MTIEIAKEFRFEAAHSLPNVGIEHQCSRLHGHSWALEVAVAGEIGAKTGWVMDFAEVKTAVGPILKALDHQYLNEVDGLENPTSENVCVWIWDRLSPGLPGLSQITLKETATSSCTYRGK